MIERDEDGRPKCAICGKPHPKDVKTFHHPIPCFPNCSLCGQKGDAPEGCVWMRTLTVPPHIPSEHRHAWAMSQYIRLLIEAAERTKL